MNENLNDLVELKNLYSNDLLIDLKTKLSEILKNSVNNFPQRIHLKFLIQIIVQSCW